MTCLATLCALLAALIVWGVAAGLPSEAQPRSQINAHNGLEWHTVGRVIDGDTLETTRGYSIRLCGMNAAELHEQQGPAARAQLKTIAQPGTMLTCVAPGKSLLCRGPATSYRRLVRQCWTVDGVDVGAEMIRRGHAEPVRKFRR